MYGRLIEDIETRLAAAVSKQRSSDEYLLDRARAAILELRGELLSIAVEAKRNKDERDGLKGELEDLKEARADEAQTEHELRKTISELRAELFPLKATLTSRNNVIKSLHDRIDRMVQSHKSVNASLSARVDSNSANVELRKQLETVSVERDRLRKEVDAREEARGMQQLANNNMADRVASLEDVLANAREISRAIEPTCRALADQAAHLHKTLSKSKP